MLQSTQHVGTWTVLLNSVLWPPRLFAQWKIGEFAFVHSVTQFGVVVTIVGTDPVTNLWIASVLVLPDTCHLWSPIPGLTLASNTWPGTREIPGQAIQRYLARQPRDTWPGVTWLGNWDAWPGNWPVMQSCWTWKKGLTVGCLCRFRPYDAQTYHVVFDVVLVVQWSAALESLVFWIWWISVNPIGLCGWQGVKYQVHVLTYFCP